GEHLHRLLHHRDILLAHGAERVEREDAAHRLLEIVPHLLLVAGKGLHALVEIGRQRPLHVAAIEADKLAHEADRQQVLALAFFLDDDLRQHLAGDVFAGLGVEDDEIDAVLDHLAEVFECDVAARGRVVQTPIGVFLDGDGFRAGRGRRGRSLYHRCTPQGRPEVCWSFLKTKASKYAVRENKCKARYFAAQKKVDSGVSDSKDQGEA